MKLDKHYVFQGMNCGSNTYYWRSFVILNVPTWGVHSLQNKKDEMMAPERYRSSCTLRHQTIIICPPTDYKMQREVAKNGLVSSSEPFPVQECSLQNGRWGDFYAVRKDKALWLRVK